MELAKVEEPTLSGLILSNRQALIAELGRSLNAAKSASHIANFNSELSSMVVSVDARSQPVALYHHEKLLPHVDH